MNKQRHGGFRLLAWLCQLPGRSVSGSQVWFSSDTQVWFAKTWSNPTGAMIYCLLIFHLDADSLAFSQVSTRASGPEVDSLPRTNCMIFVAVQASFIRVTLHLIIHALAWTSESPTDLKITFVGFLLKEFNSVGLKRTWESELSWDFLGSSDAEPGLKTTK